MTKRTGASLLHTINNAPTALMVTVGFTEEQAARMIRARRVLPLVEDTKVPQIDARKLWERIGKPHGRFNDWAAQYIKPWMERATFSTEISVVKTPARGTPRTDYLISRDVAAHLAMMARTAEGEEIRTYFMDMERLAVRLSAHTGIRALSIVGTDNQVTHMFTKLCAEDAKAGKIPRQAIKPVAMDKERRLKSTVCEVLTGHSTDYWRNTFGKGVRDVLNTEDLGVYDHCYAAARVLINGGIRKKAKLVDMLKASYGGKVPPTKYVHKAIKAL